MSLMPDFVVGGQRINRHATHRVGDKRHWRQIERDRFDPTLAPRDDDIRKHQERDLLLRRATHLARWIVDARDRGFVEASTKQSLANSCRAAGARDEAHLQVGMAQGHLESLLVRVAHPPDPGVALSWPHLYRPHPRPSHT